MGFEQQCVFKKDWEQLFTDLILAKISMNPVAKEFGRRLLRS